MKEPELYGTSSFLPLDGAEGDSDEVWRGADDVGAAELTIRKKAGSAVTVLTDPPPNGAVSHADDVRSFATSSLDVQATTAATLVPLSLAEVLNLKPPDIPPVDRAPPDADLDKVSHVRRGSGPAPDVLYLKDKITSLESENQSLQRQFKHARKAAAAADARLQQLQDPVESAATVAWRGEAEELKRQLKEALLARDDMEREALRRKQELSELKEANIALTEQSKRQALNLEAARRKAAEFEESMLQRDDDRGEINVKVTSLEEHISRLVCELGQARARAATAEQSVRIFKAEADALMHENSAYLSQLRDVETGKRRPLNTKTPVDSTRMQVQSQQEVPVKGDGAIESHSSSRDFRRGSHLSAKTQSILTAPTRTTGDVVVGASMPGGGYQGPAPVSLADAVKGKEVQHEVEKIRRPLTPPPYATDYDEHALSSRTSSAPFATDASNGELQNFIALEKQLMLLNLERVQLEAEAHRLQNRRTLQARARAAELDCRLREISLEGNRLRMELKSKPR